MKFNPKERHADIVAAQEREPFETVGPYHTMEIASWKDVERVLNQWAAAGWRLHTLRDGLRGTGIDLGYRLVLVKD